MPTIIFHDVASASDIPAVFASVQSATGGNLVEANQQHHIRFPKGEMGNAGSTMVDVAGAWTTSADCCWHIHAIPGAAAREHASVLTNPLRYNPEVGAAIMLSGYYLSAVTGGADYTKIYDLMISAPRSLIGGIDYNGQYAEAFNNILDMQPAGPIIKFNNFDTRVRNNVIISRHADDTGILVTGGSIVAGNTVFSMLGNSARGITSYAQSNTTAQNNAIFGFTTPLLADPSFPNAFNVDGHNATDKTNFVDNGVVRTATGNIAGLIAANQFVSVNPNSLDLRLKADSALINVGATLSNAGSINNINRPSGSGFDIGAWESVAPATALLLTGPTTGFIGEPLTYAIVKNGNLTGTVRVTPSDGGAGGTFTPAFYDWVEGAAAPSFNYSGTAGVKSISITNNGGLTNGTPIGLTLSQRQPTVAIATQPLPDGQSLSGTITTTQSPTSGTAYLTPDTTAPDGAISKSVAVTLGTGTGTYVFDDIEPGLYVLSVMVTNGGGTATATSATKVQIDGLGGEPEGPPASSDTIKPTMNGAITQGAVTSSTIAGSFPAASDNVAVAGYEVSKDSGNTWVDNGTSLNFSFTGLAASSSFAVRVRAYDTSGNRADTPLALAISTTAAPPVSDASNPVFAGPITISSVTGISAVATWPAGTDNSALTYDYTLDGGSTAISLGNVLSVTLPSLTPGQAYILGVRARDSSDNVSAFVNAQFTTLESPRSLSFTPSRARTIRCTPASMAFEGGDFWNLIDTRRPFGKKDPDSTIDITFDWTEVLADINDVIANVLFILSGGTATGTYAVDGLTTVFITGGVSGQISVTCRIQTASIPPRTEDRTVYLSLGDQ